MAALLSITAIFMLLTGCATCTLLGSSECAAKTPVWLPWPLSSVHKVASAWRTLAWEEAEMLRTLKSVLGVDIINHQASGAVIASSVIGPVASICLQEFRRVRGQNARQDPTLPAPRQHHHNDDRHRPFLMTPPRTWRPWPVSPSAMTPPRVARNLFA